MAKYLLLALPLAGLLGATAPAPTATITVRNKLNLARRAETITLPLKQLPAAVRGLSAASLRVRDAGKKLLVSQLVDTNADGQPDELLFQTDVPAQGTQTFTVAAGTEPVPASALTTFARFVPERTDDFAWENDRVAFRTYGPNAEQLYDKKDPNGTLSSGMDCWLKRVSYPIIDKWYGRHVNVKPFAYHTDIGEGYDPYHVGSSRGVGGTGVLDTVADKLYTSKNFATYKVLATGPIRTVFELTYAPWDAGGKQVTEKKIISLDLGSNLTRYEEHIAANQLLPNCTIGLTLHEAKGEVQANRQAGWFRYWEKIDDSNLGTGVVVAPSYLLDYQDHRSAKKDDNQLYMVTKSRQNTIVFYAGFGWQKSGQFATAAAWDAYLGEFAQRLASPLAVSWR
jgi:hypothetical protein